MSEERERLIQAVIARRNRQIRIVVIIARVIYVACAVYAVLAVVVELVKR